MGNAIVTVDWMVTNSSYGGLRFFTVDTERVTIVTTMLHHLSQDAYPPAACPACQPHLYNALPHPAHINAVCEQVVVVVGGGVTVAVHVAVLRGHCAGQVAPRAPVGLGRPVPFCPKKKDVGQQPRLSPAKETDQHVSYSHIRSFSRGFNKLFSQLYSHSVLHASSQGQGQ